MSKKKISAKPPAASKAPLSPGGEASKIITDMDIERLAARIRNREASSDQMEVFFAAIDAKARHLSQEQDAPPLDELAKALLEDYIIAGRDLRQLRAQIKRQTEYLRIPQDVSKSKKPSLVLSWIREHEKDLKLAFWTFADITLLSKNRFETRDRLPRFAMCEMTERAEDILGEIARRFPDFAREAVHLTKKLEKHSFAYSEATMRELFDGVEQRRVDEDINRGREIAEEFDELISTIILAEKQTQAETSDKIEDEFRRLWSEVAEIQKENKESGLTKRSVKIIAKRIIEKHPDEYPEIHAARKKNGESYEETIRGYLSRMKNYGTIKPHAKTSRKRTTSR